MSNRWFQLGASLIAMIMIANLQYAWTLFVKPIQAETGWGLPQIQGAFALFIIFQTWVQPLDGWLIDRFGPRWFISVAGLLCGLGWAGMGYATSVPAVLHDVLRCGRRRGVRLQRVDRIGPQVVQGAARAGRGHHGGGVRRGHGALHPAHFLDDRVSGLPVDVRHDGPAAGRRDPRGGAVPEASAARPAPPRLHHPAPPRRSSDDAPFHDAGNAPDAAVLPDVCDVRPDGQRRAPRHGQRGTDRRLVGFLHGAVLAATLSPLANGASRIFWGWASDRLGRETTMVIAFLLQAVCLFLVMAVGRISGAWFALTLVLVYFTWGEIYSLFPSATADYFGTRHATSNYAVLYTAKGVASIIGGWFGAFLYDQTGSWAVGFYGSAAMALVAAVMAIGLRATAASTKARLAASVPATAGAK